MGSFGREGNQRRHPISVLTAADVVDELDIRQEVEYVHTILEEGTSADRQLAVYRETGDLESVASATGKSGGFIDINEASTTATGTVDTVG